jgi:exodeoxyribonuclease VII small subunit
MPMHTTMNSPTPTPQPPISSVPADDKLGFDQVLDRLRQIVARLEQGNLPLEQALQAFEEGVQLSRAGSAILDAAELRVEALVRGEDGSEARQPLSPSAPSPSP